MVNIVILAPQKKGCGNFVTMRRICLYFSRNGHHCKLVPLAEVASADSYEQHLQSHSAELVVGIHAFHSGQLLITGKIPFILIFGGTDVNEFARDASKLSVMTTAVEQARSLVVFGKSVLAKAQEIWPDQVEKMKIIQQGVMVKPSSFSLVGHLTSQNLLPQMLDLKIFLFIGGIRPVKDPVFLVEAFQDWHGSNDNVYLVFIGPILDKDYFQNIFLNAIERRPGVIYLPLLPLEDVHAAMRESYALVNSSISEGMPLAVLEAMQSELLVVGRDIPALASLIQDGSSGLLYSTPQEFLTKTKYVINNESKRKEMVQAAKEFVETHHSPLTEEKLYLSLLPS